MQILENGLKQMYSDLTASHMQSLMVVTSVINAIAGSKLRSGLNVSRLTFKLSNGHAGEICKLIFSRCRTTNFLCSPSYFLSCRFQLITRYVEDEELKLPYEDIVCDASPTWKRHKILIVCISYYLPQLPSFPHDLESIFVLNSVCAVHEAHLRKFTAPSAGVQVLGMI